MGREVKRVPLDFDWPIEKVWQGYVCPESLSLPACPDCGGHGDTTALRWVVASAHMILMLDDDLQDQARGRPMHPYFNDYYSTAYGTRPSPDIHELGTGLAGREAGPIGHDALDGWAAAKKIVAAAGLDPETWGRCKTCGGSGEGPESYEGQKAEAEAWERTEPPAGEGWQLWETVSEGSPISPVFSSADSLVDWLCSPAYRWGISGPMQREQAKRFVRAGWAPSMISVGGAAPVAGECAV